MEPTGAAGARRRARRRGGSGAMGTVGHANLPAPGDRGSPGWPTLARLLAAGLLGMVG